MGIEWNGYSGVAGHSGSTWGEAAGVTEREDKSMRFCCPHDAVEFARGLEYPQQASGAFGTDAAWYGTKSVEEALHFGTHGWPDGIRAFEPTLTLARRECRSSRQASLRPDVSGPFVEPGLLFSGVPEAFALPTEIREDVADFDSVEIIANRTSSQGVPVESTEATGVLILTIAHVCETAGFPTRIVWAGGYGPTDVTIQLKDFSDPLDAPLLAFWLVNHSASRRIGFMIAGRADPEANNSNFYAPRNVAVDDSRDREKRIVFNHGMERQALWTPEAAIAEACGVLEHEGIIEREK